MEWANANGQQTSSRSVAVRGMHCFVSFAEYCCGIVRYLQKSRNHLPNSMEDGPPIVRDCCVELTVKFYSYGAPEDSG